jgi:cytochrome c2
MQSGRSPRSGQAIAIFHAFASALGLFAINPSASAQAAIVPDEHAGAEIYNAVCKGCHGVAIAPPLRGIIDRPIASVASFPGYSAGLKSKRSMTWTASNLDAFLTSPTTFAPGTLMVQTIPEAQRRADLIAYLGSMSPTFSQAPQAGKAEPFAMAVRRVTESQYRNIIRDTFGLGMQLNARFEPELREEGLQSIGNAQLSVTISGFEQYFALAKSVAAQVVDEKKRAELVSCVPADPKANDDACTRSVIERYGEGLFRRPLTQSEIAGRVKIAADATARLSNYYDGLALALASLLVDPEFLFRVEEAEPDPANPGQYRLDGFSKASRISFLLWDSAPDAELLQTAVSGSIHENATLAAQVARMMASPKLKDGAKAFFTDMLQFEHFDSLTKDGATYPKFSQKVADSAREQTLLTLMDLLVEQNRDYRDIFTSNDTFINRALAPVYKVPYLSRQDWARYTFPDDAERAGILTQISFLSLFSHPAASSPTKRGIKINEIFMCSPTPDPPADVDFSKVQALDKGTVRTRLLAHKENAGCAVCHRVSDPPGLALEHFDGIGQLRKLENGQLIDVSAEIDGASFSGAKGLGDVLRNDKRVPQCLVRNVYAYGVGRPTSDKDESYLAGETKAFAADGYRFKDLLSNIATSPGFFSVVQPAGLAPTKFGPTKLSPTKSASTKPPATLQTAAARTSTP